MNKPHKHLKLLCVRDLKVDMSLPQWDIEKYFKIYELVQEFEQDWDNQHYEVFKGSISNNFKVLNRAGDLKASLGTVRMSQQCAEKLCEMLNNGEIEL